MTTTFTHDRLVLMLDVAAAAALCCFAATLVYAFSDDIYDVVVDAVAETERTISAMWGIG